MYGRKATDLIRSLDRAAEDAVPLYNLEGVRAVCEEMKHIRSALDQNLKNARLAENSMNTTLDDSLLGADEADLSVLNTLRSAREADRMANLRSADFHCIAMERNQRCLVAYHYSRLERLRSLRWSYGAVLPAEIRANLSDKEKEWFSNYCSSLNDYMMKLGGLNLTNHQRPPRDHLIHVRVLVDFGDYETEDGEVICLRKSTRHVLPRSECENLIRQGVLEHIPG